MRKCIAVVLVNPKVSWIGFREQSQGGAISGYEELMTVFCLETEQRAAAARPAPRPAGCRSRPLQNTQRSPQLRQIPARAFKRGFLLRSFISCVLSPQSELDCPIATRPKRPDSSATSLDQLARSNPHRLLPSHT